MLKAKIRHPIQICQTKGLSKTLQESLQKIIGIRVPYKTRIDTLFFYINTFFDISNMEKASGVLRSLQQADTILLKIFNKVCEKHQLRYWLAFGTLLGAVRHKGFIPWDDDTDVQMVREDYNKAMEIFKTELLPYSIDIKANEPMSYFKICYKSKIKTGIWIDVFPVDGYDKEILCENDENVLKKRIYNYKKKYCKYKNKAIKDIEKIKRKVIYENRNIDCINTLFTGPEFYPSVLVFRNDDIFPLKNIEFEGEMFFAPNLEKGYLKKAYGNYMEFPRNGLEHHSIGKAKLSQCSSKYNFDMNEMIAELNLIYESI